MENYKLISWAEAQSEYSFNIKVNKASIPSKYLADKLVAVYSGNLEIDTLQYKSTCFPYLNNSDVVGIIVEGDLKVTQYVDLRTTDVGFGAHILVQGNFYAKGLAISGMSEFCIEKDSFISDFVIGQNAAGGQLTCNGNLHTKHALFDRFSFKLKGTFEGVLYDLDINNSNIDIPESEEGKVISVMYAADLYCVYSEELEDAEDDDSIDDEEYEGLIRKYAVFEEDSWYYTGGQTQCLLDGKDIFRNIDIQLI
jgi:hypothetical protein